MLFHSLLLYSRAVPSRGGSHSCAVSQVSCPRWVKCLPPRRELGLLLALNWRQCPWAAERYRRPPDLRRSSLLFRSLWSAMPFIGDVFCPWNVSLFLPWALQLRDAIPRTRLFSLLGPQGALLIWLVVLIRAENFLVLFLWRFSPGFFFFFFLWWLFVFFLDFFPLHLY